MSKVTNRDAAPAYGGSVEHRLARLLDGPVLARVVPHLPPETLQQLIRHSGLEACGELIAASTPAQLTSLLDIDLWQQTRPGLDLRFDVDRFGEWLEVLVDTGRSVAARTVAALDTKLVVAGLSRYIRVFDPGIFEPTAQSDDELTDRHEAMHEGDSLLSDAWSGDGPECEIGGYVVRARRVDAWDAIIALLTALEDAYGDCFQAVMQGCRHLSNSRAEIDGLDELLHAPEQHLHDIAIERQRRRARVGYATPADARAFLEMARHEKHVPTEAAGATALDANPIVTAYFRDADDAPETANEGARSPDRTLESSSSSSLASPSTDAPTDSPDVNASLVAVIELLGEAAMMPDRPRALLDSGSADPHAARWNDLRRVMAYVGETDENACLARSRELAFLGNALLAGCSIQSRALTLQEASDAAASVCNLGLEYWSTPGSSPPETFLVDHDLVAVFEVGWSVLHRDVGLFVAQELISMLAGLHCAGRDIRIGLVALRRELVKQHAAGTPWRARGAAEILAMLDTTAWVSVVGLLDECPVLPAALTAVLEGRTSRVSATAFDFISTSAQIGDVRAFMRKLPDLLSR